MDDPQPTSSGLSSNPEDNQNEEGETDEPHSMTESSMSESLKRKAPFAADIVPQLIDNKRKVLEKSLSAAQRDKLLMAEAKQETESRLAIADAMKEASSKFSEVIDNISGSINTMTNTSGKSIEMLSHAMSSSCQPSNQNYFYQNHALNPPYFRPNPQSHMASFTQNTTKMGENGSTYEDI